LKPLTAVGASAKAAAFGEPPKKKHKTDEWHLPAELQELETRPEQLDLALSSAFHVLELLLEEWLGHGLIGLRAQNTRRRL